MLDLNPPFCPRCAKPPMAGLDVRPRMSCCLAAAHTIPRERRAVPGYFFDAQRFSKLKTPTLFLLGGDSPPFLKAGSEALQPVLPNSKIVVLRGQQHAAMDTGTELFVTEVLRFLEER